MSKRTGRPNGRPAAPPAPWLPEAQELAKTTPLPRVARKLRDQMPGLTTLQAFYRVRWELGRAKLCRCGGPKSKSALMCRSCRLERGWRNGPQGPAPRLIDEPTVLLAKKLYDAGLGLASISKLLLPRTRYRNWQSMRISIESQFETRRWPLRSHAEAMALVHARSAGRAPGPEELLKAFDSTPELEARSTIEEGPAAPPLTEPLAVGRTWLLPAPRASRTINEFAYGHGQSALEYWDANNECSHGWLPHEGCQECAGADIIELPHRDELAAAA